MQEINLLKTRTQITSAGHAWENQSRSLLVILWLAVFLLAVAGGGLIYLGKKAQADAVSVTASNNDYRNQLLEKQDVLDQAKIFQAQLLNLDTLISQHVYVSLLLNEVEKMTYQKAQYLTLNAGDDGIVRLQGRAGTYSDLGKLMLGLSTSEKFTNVRLMTATPSNDETNSYVFTIDMRVNPSIFYKK